MDGMNEKDMLKAEEEMIPSKAPDQSDEDTIESLKKENEQLRCEVLKGLMRTHALAMGVKPQRIDTLLKLADTAGIDACAKNANELAEKAVKKALEEVPELKASGAKTGHLGAHPRASAKSPDPFSNGFGF